MRWLLVLSVLTLVGCKAAASAPADSEPAKSEDDREWRPEVVKSEEEWKKILTDEEFRILRKKGTERAFSGEYYDAKTPGTYVCAGCGQPLFSSDHKFESGTGWPSYYQPISKDAIHEERDSTLGMVRTEVLCSRCGGHLGHVFEDGPPPTGLRYCINSVALDLKPETRSGESGRSD